MRRYALYTALFLGMFVCGITYEVWFGGTYERGVLVGRSECAMLREENQRLRQRLSNIGLDARCIQDMDALAAACRVEIAAVESSLIIANRLVVQMPDVDQSRFAIGGDPTD